MGDHVFSLKKSPVHSKTSWFLQGSGCLLGSVRPLCGGQCLICDRWMKQLQPPLLRPDVMIAATTIGLVGSI